MAIAKDEDGVLWEVDADGSNPRPYTAPVSTPGGTGGALSRAVSANIDTGGMDKAAYVEKQLGGGVVGKTAGTLTRIGDSTLDLPENLATAAKAAYDDPAGFAKGLWKSKASIGGGVVGAAVGGPGGAAGGAMAGQAVDQWLNDDPRSFSERAGDVAMAGPLGNAPVSILKRVAPVAKPVFQSGGNFVRQGATATANAAERVAPRVVTPIRRGVASAQNKVATIGSVMRGEMPGQAYENATGLPRESLINEARSQVSDPMTAKGAVKQVLSRSSGIPVDALEEVVRNPAVMEKYMALGDDAWQRFTEGQQAKIRDLPAVESKVYETVIENSTLKPDATDVQMVDIPGRDSLGQPISMGKKEVKTRVIGTPIDNSGAAASFDKTLRDLGVIDDQGAVTLGNRETSGLLGVTEAEARHLLELREILNGADSFSTVKAAIKRIDADTTHSAKAVKPISTPAEAGLSQARRAMAEALEQADTSGSVKAANARYAKFRKFYDDIETDLGGKGAVNKFRNAQKGEKTLLKENLERLHGKRPLPDLDPRYPTEPVSLWETGDDSLREIDLMQKGDYFNPNRPEPITSTGRDMMGLGAGAVSGTIGALAAGAPGGALGSAATGLLWYNTRPAQLGKTLLKFGKQRAAYEASPIGNVMRGIKP